jgi:hypothetical protein
MVDQLDRHQTWYLQINAGGAARLDLPVMTSLAASIRSVNMNVSSANCRPALTVGRLAPCLVF